MAGWLGTLVLASLIAAPTADDDALPTCSEAFLFAGVERSIVKCKTSDHVSVGGWCKPLEPLDERTKQSHLPTKTQCCSNNEGVLPHNLSFWLPQNKPSDACEMASTSTPPLNADMNALDTVGGLHHQRWAQGRKSFQIARSSADCACTDDGSRSNKAWVWQGTRGACWIEWSARKFCTLLGRRRMLFLGGSAAERAFVATHNAVAWGFSDEYGQVGCQSQLVFGAMEDLAEWSGWVKLVEPTIVVLEAGNTLKVTEIETALRRVHEELSVLGVQLAWLMWAPPCDPAEATASYATRRQLTEIATTFWKSRHGNTAVVLDIAKSAQTMGTASDGDKSSGETLSTALPQLLLQAMRYGNPLADPASTSQKTWAMQAALSAEAHAVHSTCHHRHAGYMTFGGGRGFNNQLIAIANAAWIGLQTNHTMVFPRLLDWMHTRFDLRPLFAAFCFVDESSIPLGVKTTRYTKSNMFYTHIQYSDSDRWFNFRSALLELLLHRPNELLATAVSRVKRQVLGGLPYVGLHVRNINSATIKWVQRMKHFYGPNFERGPSTARLNGTHANTTWEMAPDYVASQLAVYGLTNTTIFLAHDRESDDRVERLQNASHIKVVQALPSVYPELKGKLDAILVDMLVLIDAELFLGNEASTVSWNVVSVRRARGHLRDNILGPDH